MANDISAADNIKLGINTALLGVRTSVPGIIESFDPATQLASVQPAITSVFVVDGEVKNIELPLLINVQVSFPKSGGFVQTMPVKNGDECVIMVYDRDITRWYESSGVQPPNTLRTHDMSSAWCIVGISSKSNAIPSFNNNDLEIRDISGLNSVSIRAGGGVSVKSGGELSIESTTNVVVKAPNIKLDAPVIDVGGVNLAQHTHPVISLGAETGPSTLPPAQEAL